MWSLPVRSKAKVSSERYKDAAAEKEGRTLVQGLAHPLNASGRRFRSLEKAAVPVDAKGSEISQRSLVGEEEGMETRLPTMLSLE